MSDPNVNQLPPSLNPLIARIDKLSRKVDELDILAYRYKCLSFDNQIDVMAFEICHELDMVKEALHAFKH